MLLGGSPNVSQVDESDPFGAYMAKMMGHDPATAAQFQSALNQQRLLGFTTGLGQGNTPHVGGSPITFASAMNSGLLGYQQAQNGLIPLSLTAAETQKSLTESKYRTLEGAKLGYQISNMPGAFAAGNSLNEKMKNLSQGGGGVTDSSAPAAPSTSVGAPYKLAGGDDATSGGVTSLAMLQAPEVQEQVAKKIGTTSGLQHWGGVDPNTGKAWNPTLRAAFDQAGLPLSGPVSEEQWEAAKPLILQHESMGGQNVRNYRFDATHTAGGPFQITNSTWKAFGGPIGQSGSSGPQPVPAGAGAGGAAPISPGFTMTEGDSIGVGFQKHGNLDGNPVGGRNPEAILANIQRNLKGDPDYYRDQTVLLSTGTMNDREGHLSGYIPQQVQAIQGAGGRVVLAGADPHKFSGRNDMLAGISDQTGVPFAGPLVGTTPNEIHPGPNGYRSYLQTGSKVVGAASQPRSGGELEAAYPNDPRLRNGPMAGPGLMPAAVNAQANPMAGSPGLFGRSIDASGSAAGMTPAPAPAIPPPSTLIGAAASGTAPVAPPAPAPTRLAQAQAPGQPMNVMPNGLPTNVGGIPMSLILEAQDVVQRYTNAGMGQQIPQHWKDLAALGIEVAKAQQQALNQKQAEAQFAYPIARDTTRGQEEEKLRFAYPSSYATTLGQRQAAFPFNQSEEFYKSQLRNAEENNKPVTAQPGQTVNINPTRVPIPAPQSFLSTGQFQGGQQQPIGTAPGSVPITPQQRPSGGAQQPAGTAPAPGPAPAPQGAQAAPGSSTGLNIQGPDITQYEFAKDLGTKASTKLMEKRDVADAAADAIVSNNQARGLLDSPNGVYTGPGADYKLFFGRLLGGKDRQEQVANTEAFVAQRANAMRTVLKAFGSGSGVSNTDVEYAETIVAGKKTLTEGGMRKILDDSDKLYRYAIQKHNKDAADVEAKTQVPYRLTVEEPEPYKVKLPEGFPPDAQRHSDGKWYAPKLDGSGGFDLLVPKRNNP